MSEAPMNDSENAELRRVYASTARDEPPTALDDAILARARSAILTDPRSAILADPRSAILTDPQSVVRSKPSSRHWSQLLAVAATLVVTASLVVLMEQEKPQIVLGPPARDTAFTPAEPVPTEAAQASKVAPSELARRDENPRARYLYSVKLF